jgi:hypothetical protein
MATLASPVKSLTNVTLDYDGGSLEEHARETSVGVSVDTIDATVLADANASEIPTNQNWEPTVSGFWSPTLDGILGPDAVTPPTTLKTFVYVVGPAGSTRTFTWTTLAFVSNYEITATADGTVDFSATIGVSGSPAIS